MNKAADLMNIVRRRAEEESAALPGLLMAAEETAQSVMHGEHARRRAGAGEKFWQFREYAPHDRPQDIDWRQSAKTDRVFIRQKEKQNPHILHLWCAGGPGMGFKSRKDLPEKAEAAKILTLAAAILTTRAGEKAGLMGRVRAGHSEKTIEDIGAALCNPHYNENALPDFDRIDIPKRGTGVFCGDFLSEIDEIEHAFDRVSSSMNSCVIQILDPAEIDLPFSGRVRFEDMGDTDDTLINDVVSIRSAYQQRIKNHIQALQACCGKRGWHYFLHRTDRPVKDTLFELWQGLSRPDERRFA